LHRVHVDEFQISRVPVTNAQYALFVQDTNTKPPQHWRFSRPEKGKEDHPVVNVSWRAAQSYCHWLSKKTSHQVRLPSEAEWEKAARGDHDRRAYPWGEEWEYLRCNTFELGLEETTAVGIFAAGASPYGCLDMAGNVWEWTQTKQSNYPYKADDERNDPKGNEWRVLRGGSWGGSRGGEARCAYRFYGPPDGLYVDIGFRVVVVSSGSRS